MGRGRDRRRGWGGGCGCEYVEFWGGFSLLSGLDGVGGKRLMAVWVVGSSWLMMLRIRGMSTVWVGKGKRGRVGG